MAAIEFNNVIKRYGTGPKANQVIHGVNAEVKDGEFVVIVGPSGCGKSTLLRVLIDLAKPSSGTVKLDTKSGITTPMAPMRAGCWATVAASLPLATAALPSSVPSKPTIITSLPAACTARMMPLSFFVVAPMRPCRVEPAPETRPTNFVALGVPLVCATWKAETGFGPK